jgi:hypothetical protein
MFLLGETFSSNTLDSSTRTDIVDPNWHGSKPLHKECEWKQGESAVVSITSCKQWEIGLQVAVSSNKS